MNAHSRHFTAKKSRRGAKADHEHVFEMKVSNSHVELHKKRDAQRAKQIRKGKPLSEYDQSEEDQLAERELAYQAAERESGLRQFTYSKPVPSWTGEDLDRVIAGMLRLLPADLPALMYDWERGAQRRGEIGIAFEGPVQWYPGRPLEIRVTTPAGWWGELALPCELPAVALGEWLLHWKLRCETVCAFHSGATRRELEARASALPPHVAAMRDRMLQAMGARAVDYLNKKQARIERVVARAMAKEPPPPTVSVF